MEKKEEKIEIVDEMIKILKESGSFDLDKIFDPKVLKDILGLTQMRGIYLGDKKKTKKDKIKKKIAKKSRKLNRKK